MKSDPVLSQKSDFNSRIKWGLRAWLFLVSVGSSSAPASAGAAWRSVGGTARVLDGLVHRQDEAGCLRRSRQGVDPHDGWLPDTGAEVVSDVLVVDVHAEPHTALRPEKRVNSQAEEVGARFVASVSCPTCACLALSLLRMLVASKPALSHSCLGMISRALAYAPMSSCCFPGMVLE